MSIYYRDVCDVGCLRKTNQDSIFSDVKGDNAIFAVADGMGGHSCGEMASSTVVKMLADWWRRNYTLVEKMEFQQCVEQIEKIVFESNYKVYAEYEKKGLTGGTTLSAVFICGDRYALFTVGDSRVYTYDKEGFKQLSVDDVWENLPENKEKSQQEILNNPRYGSLTQALGYSKDVKVRLYTDKIQKEISFLICSDGVYKFLHEKVIKRYLKRARNKWKLNLLIQNIKEDVYKQGAGDNLSAILIFKR